MADEDLQKAGELRLSILETIQANVKELNVNALAARMPGLDTDLYSKNTSGDAYAKNTQLNKALQAFDPAAIAADPDRIAPAKP